MKKMNYLKPNMKNDFLQNGSRTEVSYIDINEDITLDKLKQDIAAGAKQFRPVADLFMRTPSRVILIDADSKEEGLMAINYMAGIFNNTYNYKKQIPSASFESEDDIPYYNYDEEIDFDEDVDVNIYQYSIWRESPWYVPVVPLSEMRNYYYPMEHFIHHENRSYSTSSQNEDAPYWVNCIRKPICIFVDANSMYDMNILKHFERNEHLFILRVNKLEGDQQFPWDSMPPFIDEDEEDDEDRVDNFKYELLLEYAADTLNLSISEDDRLNYYEALLHNWANVYSLKFEPNFPFDKIVREIEKMKRPNKSHMIDRLINAIQIKKERAEDYNKDTIQKDTVLTKQDFLEFDIFKYILKDKRATVPAYERLETELIGMDSVKKQVREIIEIMKFNQRRRELGLPNEAFHNIHILLGAPGTAKSTVAKLMGTIMMEENLLPNNRFICVNGAELKGMYVGHSAPKTKQIFRNYDVIMIDEAYSLTSSDGHGSDSFSQEALAQLMIELEKHGTDKLVMFAGYGGEQVNSDDNRMSAFINANPGLKSRINSTIVFPSYSPEEMVQIVHKQAELLHFNIDNEADALLYNYFNTRTKDRTFGNGREARSLIENCERYIAERVMKLSRSKQTKKACSTILLEDVKKAITKLESDTRAQHGSNKHLGFV